MSASDLKRKFDRFLFALPSQVFFEWYVWIFYPFCLVYKIWRIDWNFYRTMEPWLYHPVGLPAILHLPFPSEMMVGVLQIVATISGLAAMVGFQYRTFASVFFLCMLLADAWPNMFGFINVEIHLVWFSGFMIFAELDRKKRGKMWTAPLSSLAFRLIELIIVLAYFQSGVSKLLHGGIHWALDGTTLQIGLIRQGVPLGLYLSNFPNILIFLSIITLIWELSFPIYFFVLASRKFYLFSAICFHLSTWLTMNIDFSHLWNFTLSVLILYPVILQSQNQPKARALILFDDSCLFCNRFIRLLIGNNVYGELAVGAFGTRAARDVGVEVLPSEAFAALLVTSDGRNYSGAQAIIHALKYCSFFWRIAGIILSLPGFFQIFTVFYNAFAPRRRHLFRHFDRDTCLGPPSGMPNFNFDINR